jgi:16S rRNA A1518/A1519 N6-dimethyltransferase RsmA/KsgA/DIM1 with predicted DNA glycosylase/AP lyase activity
MDREQKYALRYSRNEFTNTRLLKTILGRSGIRFGDRVLDIGAGSGIITRALLDRGARVIAIEKDKQLYLKCRQLSLDRPGLTAVNADFLDYPLPSSGSHKVFANIPFSCSADILHKLLFALHPPEDCYLIVQKEVALKYTGSPHDTLMSLLIEPLWWSAVVCHLDRTDFSPQPSVDIVLLQFQKRTCRLVAERNYPLYCDFVVFCRESGLRTAKRVLGKLFSYRQFKQISARLGIPYDSRPADLSFGQYLGLFQAYLASARTGHAVIRYASQRFLQTQLSLEKVHRTRVSGGNP